MKKTVVKNPYAKWLERFRKPTSLPPKKPSVPQFYMHQTDFVGKVTAAFKAWCEAENTPKSHWLALCNDIVKELFSQELEEIQDVVKKALNMLHNELLSDYNKCLKGVPSANPNDQAV